MRFADKVVFVTGSSRGLGAYLVYAFAKEGASVVINYNKSYEDAVFLKKKIEEFGSCMLVCGDVSLEEDVSRMTQEIISCYGKIDILVNNAGICNDSLFDLKNVSSFRKVLDVNLIGTYLVSKYIGKIMLENKSGKIINISSDNGIDRYYPESCDYDASKAGVISLTHNMARFYAPYVNVNCVCPGWMNTDMNKNMDDSYKKGICNKILLGRFGEVSEISNLVLFLASDDASYVNDSIIKVNGGINNE
ncbi:MAG: SDR family oxidoreductase [bacterium]|nr:SDR family oxidoreductase [bacterium]